MRTHTHARQVAHTQTSQTPTQSHKEEEVFQAVCKTQGDPLIGCVIMIRLKLRGGEKKKGKKCKLIQLGHEWQGQAEGEV